MSQTARRKSSRYPVPAVCRWRVRSVASPPAFSPWDLGGWARRRAGGRADALESGWLTCHGRRCRASDPLVHETSCRRVSSIWRSGFRERSCCGAVLCSCPGLFRGGKLQYPTLHASLQLWAQFHPFPLSSYTKAQRQRLPKLRQSWDDGSCNQVRLGGRHQKIINNREFKIITGFWRILKRHKNPGTQAIVIITNLAAIMRALKFSEVCMLT